MMVIKTITSDGDDGGAGGDHGDLSYHLQGDNIDLTTTFAHKLKIISGRQGTNVHRNW